MIKKIKQEYQDYNYQIKSILFGVAIGDAMGVPFEFKKRETILENPVTDMVGYGTYNLPAGTFSDDSSLTFCLAEALTQDFNINTIGNNFVKWYRNNYWTATGKVFDVGLTTVKAIERLERGENPILTGRTDNASNGNGSLMRISPLLFYLLDKNRIERFEIIKRVSSITHGHIRSVIACFYYLEFLNQLLENKNKFEIYKNLQVEIPSFLFQIGIEATEIKLFDTVFKNNIQEFPAYSISSSGYVLHTLEASIWCLLTTDSYEEAILKAVNLGEDTDTTGAVTGALAGLLYGYENIPTAWRKQIARHNDIENLANRFAVKTRKFNYWEEVLNHFIFKVKKIFCHPFKADKL